MQRLRWLGLSTLLGLALALLTTLQRAGSQEIIQYGFEGRETVWGQGNSKASFRETAHRITDESARSGQRSEYLQLVVEQGEFIHYTYNVGRAPVNEDLTASIFVRASRPGIQILARVVLPQERDPNNPSQPLTVLLGGDTYAHTSRWQQVAVRQPVKLLTQKVQLLRDELKKPDINVTGAFVDQLILNVYCGPGPIDIYLDDMEVGPVLDAKQAGPKPLTTPARTMGTSTTAPGVMRRTGTVEVKDKQLFVADGQKLFIRGIRHRGTPLKTLSDALFNVVWLDESSPPGLIEDAANLGFWIVPSITPPAPPRQGEAQLTSNEAFARKVGHFLPYESVLAWDLGGDKEFEQLAAVNRLADAYHAVDPMRPFAVDVRDGGPFFSRGKYGPVMVGMHRWPLMTSMELSAYREWLNQRRLLAGPSTFCWTWIQTHLPDWFTTVAYERDQVGTLSEPIGPQPEQIRLMTYLALGCGYRGVAYWSDRFLADSHSGRDRLLALAQLNQEIKLLEPILVESEVTEWIDTNDTNVKVAVLRQGKKPTILALPVWIGPGSQFVPGQGAVPALTFKVPAVPLGCQAWEVSPGQVKSLKWTRKTGGNEITLHEFCLTAAVVFTSDLSGLVVKLQKEQREMAPAASQWAYDQATEEYKKVEQVHQELVALGQKLKDGDALLKRSKDYLESCMTHRRAGDHAEAYAEAQRAMRPLRMLMREHWDTAVKKLGGVAVASPYAVSFYTLPRHLRFWDQVTAQRVATNVLPDGDFELAMDKVPQGWLQQEAPSLDNTVCSALRSAGGAKEGKQCLKMEVKAKDPLTAAAVLERTYIAIHSPAVRLQPGTLVRVSAWIKVPATIVGSPDGAMFYDSVGGEPLAVRLTASQDWKQVILFRKVPASGSINVTLAMTGIGVVMFDDVRIEPLVPPGTAPTTAAVR